MTILFARGLPTCGSTVSQKTMQSALQGMHGSAYLGKNGVASMPLVVPTLRSQALPASNLQTLSPRHERFRSPAHSDLEAHV